MIEYDLIGDVGYEINSTTVGFMLNEAKGEDVRFYIATMGGDISEGILIKGLIDKYRGNSEAVLIGHTASAGTIIALGCDKVYCNRNAPFLIHYSINTQGGNKEELSRVIKQLEVHDKILINIYF